MVGRLLANTILNFHFDYLNPSLSVQMSVKTEIFAQLKIARIANAVHVTL